MLEYGSLAGAQPNSLALFAMRDVCLDSENAFEDEREMIK